MSFHTWLLFAVVSVPLVISPGPAILLAISNALRYGAGAVLFSAAGNTLGLIIVGFGVSFGLAALMAASATAFAIVKFAGAIYLIYLGVKLWRGREGFSLEAEVSSAAKRPSRLFFEALFIAVTNPKAIIILAALLPPFVNASEPALPQVAVMSVTYAGMCFLNHLLLAFAGGWLRRAFNSEWRMRTLRRTLGVMFVGFGAALAATSR